MHTLPLDEGLHGYAACCGKTICGGCSYQHQMKSRERTAERGQTPERPTCEFCREPISDSDEETLARCRKRVELKDPTALYNMAEIYGTGLYGLPMNETKCIELLRESAGLGHPGAQYNLGNYYKFGKMGLEQNNEEAQKYWMKAAEGGDVVARHNLGYFRRAYFWFIKNDPDPQKWRSADQVATMRHWRLAASGGHRRSMTALIECFFEAGLLHHADLAETLQAFYRAQTEMKTEDRDRYIKYLKETGEYHPSTKYEDR